MLFGRLHLAEGARPALRHEHRVVAEAARSARRPDQRAFDDRFEVFRMSVRPGDAKCRDEMRCAARRRKRAVIAQQASRDRRRALADALIHNDGITPDQLRFEVRALWALWWPPPALR